MTWLDVLGMVAILLLLAIWWAIRAMRALAALWVDDFFVHGQG